MEDDHAQNLKLLAVAASDFASYPGAQSDASVKEFLDRFPLPLILSALESYSHAPALESTVVSCLERIFKTRYGASFIPQYMPFVRAGLQANSQLIRRLACNTVSYLLENVNGDGGTAVQLVIDYGIYPLLVDCLIDGNELVMAASTDAIASLARFSHGLGIIFPSNGHDALHLKNIAMECSSLARMRVLGLIAKLFSVSSLAASAVYDSNLLGLLEAEVNNKSDVLMTLSALELLYELAESPHGANFLLKTTLLQRLTSMISDTSVEAILRSRAVWISGRLLSADNLFDVTDKSNVESTLLAIDGRLELLKNENTDERESALEALGLIGTSNQGASMLLSSPIPLARHVVEAAFDQHGRGKQLAALHALANICGENRPEDAIMLCDDAEESLRRLIYKTAAESSKLTPSGLFLSVLQQDSETRLAAYRLIAGLVARTWCLLDICSKQEIIDIVTDAHTETNKKGMEIRYNCCVAISKALSAYNKVNDPAYTGIASKVWLHVADKCMVGYNCELMDFPRAHLYQKTCLALNSVRPLGNDVLAKLESLPSTKTQFCFWLSTIAVWQSGPNLLNHVGGLDTFLLLFLFSCRKLLEGDLTLRRNGLKLSQL